MASTLFGLPASHPTVTTELMLERKGIAFRRLDLIPAAHRVILRAMGFPGITVPAVRLDGTRIQGSRTISRALDALQPEPPLFPRDPERRAAVEHAEAWGDEVLQPVPRRLTWGALKRDRSTIETFLSRGLLPIPNSLAVATSGPIVAISAPLNRAGDETVRADLARLPALLDRVDAWLEDGTLGADEPNAADYQIAPSVRLLTCLDDLREAVEARPAGRYAQELVPAYPGRVPRVFPAEWLAGLRGRVPVAA